MLIAVYDKFYSLLSFGLGESPSESLQRSAYFNLLVEFKQELFDFLEVKRGEIWLNNAHLLLDSLWWASGLLLSEITNVNLESVLEFTLDRSDFILERVIAELRLPLAVIVLLLIGIVSNYLLFVLFDKGRLKHINAMLAVNFIWVVLQKSFIPVQFLLNGHQRYFTNRLLHIKSIQSV